MSSRSERLKEELEQTNMLKTMIIESDDDDEPYILEEIEEFEDKIDYLDIDDEKKQKLIKLCSEIKEEQDENVREYLFKLLKKEVD